jgi:hypothetical protein
LMQLMAQGFYWIPIIFCEQYKLWSSSLSLLCPNILISTLFSNILNLCSSLNVRDQVSHPYKTCKIIVLYILIFTLLVSKTKDADLHVSRFMLNYALFMHNIFGLHSSTYSI